MKTDQYDLLMNKMCAWADGGGQKVLDDPKVFGLNWKNRINITEMQKCIREEVKWLGSSLDILRLK